MSAINISRKSNPYKPGAGRIPPYLAGREYFINAFESVTEILNSGEYSNSFIFYGLRGVGKTALINEFQNIAAEQGLAASEVIEFSKKETLRDKVGEAAEQILLNLSYNEKAKNIFKKTTEKIKGFGINLSEIGISIELSDTRSIGRDLPNLMESIGQICLEGGTGAVFFLDEIQNLNEEEMESICMAFHKVSQKELPVFLVGAGLPNLKEQLFEATGYASRLFDYQELKLLEDKESVDALNKPVENSNFKWAKPVLNEIQKETQGHPYFIQEYGKISWELWKNLNSPLSQQFLEDHLSNINRKTKKSFYEDFFEPHFKRATESEQGYLIEMSKTEGIIKSGPLREKLAGSDDLREALIKKELIWVPKRGEVAFTIAGFKEYLLEEYPN